MVELCDDRAVGLIEPAGAPAAIEWKLIGNPAELFTLRVPWNDLAAQSKDAHPFVISDWVEACLHDRAPHVRPAVVTAMRDNQLELLWPLAFQGKVPGRRRLYFAAQGPSDYQSLLMREISPSLMTGALKALDEHLEWDVLDLYPLTDEDAASYAAQLKTISGMAVMLERVGLAAGLDLSDGWQDRVAQRLRHTVEQKCRRLKQRIGPLSLRRAESRATCDDLITGLYALHIRRWAQTDTPSKFADPGAQRRYRALVHAWLRHNLLALHGLYVADHLIAVHVGAQVGERFYSHVAAYDPQFGAYSPGTVLLWKLLEDCWSHGVRTFDFLRGEEAYKTDWGAVKERGYWRLQAARTRMGVAAYVRAMDETRRMLSRYPHFRQAARRIKHWIGE